MKTILTKNSSKTAGVELRVFDDNNNLIEVKDVRISKDGIAYELPTNPSNRKFVNIVNFLKLDVDEMELEYKAPRNTQTSTKSWMDYLTEDEKALLAQIKHDAETRMIEAQTKAINDEIAKLEALKATLLK